MKKIIHVISDSNIGGAGKYLLTYLENCDRTKFDVCVVVPFNSKLKPYIENLGIKIYETDGLAEKSFSKTAIFELIRIFKEQKPDIVHSHACLSARISARLCGVCASFYTRHSVFPQSFKLTNPVGKFINGKIGSFLSDGIIAVADAARQNLLETGIDDKKIRVIYNGVNPQKVLSRDEKTSVREKYGISENEKVVSIIARLEEVKGHRYFIDAAKIVGETHKNVKFIIAGVGSCEGKLKEYAREQCADNLIFLGFLPNIYELENITYIQANASYGTEAASLSLLEGMSLKIPAVVSDFGGNPELIKNNVNGFVVKKQNALELSKKIIEILDDDNLYKKLSDGAAEEFEKRFTAKIMTENMEKFYLDVLEEKKK